MKKNKGFTLAEVLISIGIVGVIAMFFLPTASKFRPDINKIMYLKTYDNLREIIQVIASNKEAYPLINLRTGVVHDVYPLFNVYAIYKHDGLEWVGPSKICNMLAEGLNIKEGIICTDEYNIAQEPDFKKSFETVDGVHFMVQTSKKRYNYKTDIFIDVNGNNEPNCFATNVSCKKPDRFKFLLSADANLIAADSLGKSYLDTRANWKYNQDFNPVGDLVVFLPNIFPEKLSNVELGYVSTNDKFMFVAEPTPDKNFKPVSTYIMTAVPGSDVPSKNMPAEFRHFYHDSKHKNTTGVWEDNLKGLETLKKTEFIGLYKDEEDFYYAYIPKNGTYVWGSVGTHKIYAEYLKSKQREDNYMTYNYAKVYNGKGAEKIDNNGQTW